MKKIYWLVLATTVAMVGCGKAGISEEAKIVSDCSLNGRGEYKCTFKNKGAAKGSSCEHIVLEAKLGYENTFGIGYRPSTRLGNLTKYSRSMAELHAMGGATGPVVIEEPKQRKGTFNEEIDKELTAGIKQAVNKSGENLNKYITDHLVVLAITDYEKDKRGLSRTEVCSGIVEAGDVREVNGLALFGSEGISPVDACFNAYGDKKWTDACSFTTVTVAELDKLLKAKFESVSSK